MASWSLMTLAAAAIATGGGGLHYLTHKHQPQFYMAWLDSRLPKIAAMSFGLFKGNTLVLRYICDSITFVGFKESSSAITGAGN